MIVNKPKIDIIFAIINLIIVLGFVILFTGCSSKELTIKTEATEKVKLNLTNPNKIYLEQVEFIVITEDNSKEVFSNLEKNSTDKVLYGITDEDYKKMSLNLLKIRQYIYQQQVIINSYKDYYEK